MAVPRPTKPSLPTGTVTFLFTDIEGSTRLWETERAAMQTALARHDLVLLQAIEVHNGHVVKTTGDGALAVFALAIDALEASIAAQRALVAEPWPSAVRILVRMALHSGPAEYRNGDYFGPTLNRVARLLTLGHGGQTLVSAISRDLCQDYLPPNVSLKSLGEHRLKDLDRRESVFEVHHAGAQQIFPPLRTLVPAPTLPSIAVLPFADLSPEKDQEYFADGLAEELLNVFSKIQGLRVASRTSAFSFKGLKVDIPTVGQKLNVATVLEGSVRTSRKRVRITTQLIQVATDSQLWSQTYDRDLEDIFAAQENIAQSVVNELRAELLGEKLDARASAAVKAEVQAAAKGRGESADAYRLYLQGRFFANRFTREDTANAIVYYRRALEIDPDYALAWAGLSRAHSDQAGFSWNSVAEAFQKARESAEAALRLEPDLAEGHHALGVVRMLNDWDWNAADASFRRAVELSPSDAQLMRDAGVLAGNLGRAEEAIGLLQRAVVFDPLSVQTYRSLGRMCFFADRLEEAEAAIIKALELNPQGELSHWSFGLVRLAQGQPDEALQMFLREGHEIFRLLGLAMAKHVLARPQESDEALGELIKKHRADAAYQIALGYAFRAEIDFAFEWLERAYSARDPGLSHAKVTPLLRNLHANAQWQPFLDKLGLAD